MKQMFISLLLLCCSLLQFVKSCDQIIQCELNDPQCLVQLDLFQTCVSSRCDQSYIESQNTEELTKCYSETCSSKYEPFNQIIQNYSNCLIQKISEQNQHFNLPILETIIEPSLLQKCGQRLADLCIQLSPECPQKLNAQIECAKKNCFSPDNPVLVDFCFSQICKPDLIGLDILNKDYVQCLSNKQQSQTDRQPYLKSSSEILIQTLIILVTFTLLY
ncbi:hypothetical protein ABPG74_015079 [Tetrahymena malaccensis]